MWEGQDEKGHRVLVEAWEHLHLKQAREIAGMVIRVTRFGAAESQRDPRVSWFLWVGQAPAPLARVWSLYKRRYSQEHGYRFCKQALLWDQPRLRTPAQFERWTWLVAAVLNQLVLARGLVQESRLPWESRTRPATPQQVRRAMAPILATDGAHPPTRAIRTRKIAGLAQRQSQDPCPTLSGCQKTQTRAQKASQTGLSDLFNADHVSLLNLVPRFRRDLLV